MMKSFSKILFVVRNLPEEVRKLLAGFFLLIAAVLLFNNWAAGVSSDLTLAQFIPAESAAPKKSLGPKPVGEIPTAESAPAAPAPFESIADSIKSLKKIIKSPPADSGEAEINIKQRINNLAAGLYGSLEKIWKYIYEPLR